MADNKDTEVLFVFKGNKTPKKIGTVKDFNIKFAFCISNLIGDKLMEEIRNTIKKAEETLGAEKGDNNTVSKSEKSKGEELLPTLTGIYQRVRDSLNKFSTLENDEKYTKKKRKKGEDLQGMNLPKIK